MHTVVIKSAGGGFYGLETLRGCVGVTCFGLRVNSNLKPQHETRNKCYCILPARLALLAAAVPKFRRL